MPPCCGLPMSSHHVTRHGPRCDYRPTLPARHSLSLQFSICFPYPRQAPTVACLSPVAGPRPTGVTGHADCLPDISPQAYPVEDGYRGSESALEPGGVRRDDYPVVGVELGTFVIQVESDSIIICRLYRRIRLSFIRPVTCNTKYA